MRREGGREGGREEGEREDHLSISRFYADMNTILMHKLSKFHASTTLDTSGLSAAPQN